MATSSLFRVMKTLKEQRSVFARRGRGARSRPPALQFLVITSLILLTAAGGCGGTPVTRAEEEVVTEAALRAALGGEKVEFVTLVAPSFLAEVRAEMPDSSDETLGGVLIAGFLEDIPFTGIIEAHYPVWEYGQSLVVYVWGRFIDADGSEMVIGEADAIRIPLVFEDGRWYIDLLDL